jgi:hypothetical protein
MRTAKEVPCVLLSLPCARDSGSATHLIGYSYAEVWQHARTFATKSTAFRVLPQPMILSIIVYHAWKPKYWCYLCQELGARYEQYLALRACIGG